MGIEGLQKYINSDSDQCNYLVQYELRNTYLVIDGNNIAYQLCNRDTYRYCKFGGDYDQFAKCVREFFDNLKKCKITPLVLIDGGRKPTNEADNCPRPTKKKKPTNEADNCPRHTKKKKPTNEADNCPRPTKKKKPTNEADNHPKPTKKKDDKFTPLLMIKVFKDVMDEKDIKYAQCTFKADNEIAAVAKICDCPVLSNDSDFFVYDVKYIPYDTLKNDSLVQIQEGECVWKCKIFRIENFLSSFAGLDRHRLTLAATLVGHKYTDQSLFQVFFQECLQYTHEDQKIIALLNWLRNRTLEDAVRQVLKHIPEEEDCCAALKKIKEGFNGYSITFPSMLDLLVPTENVAGFKSKGVETFKLQGDIAGSLEIVKESRNDVEVNDDDFLRGINAPDWFIHDYRKGKFPSYFIQMMISKEPRMYIYQLQQQDFKLEIVAETKSFTILHGIFELLTSDINNGSKKLLCLTPNIAGTKPSNWNTIPGGEIFTLKFPSFKNLNNLSVDKKNILIKILNIPKEIIADEVLSEWRLYLASIVYWARQKRERKEPLVTVHHIYCLLRAMVFGIDDEKAKNLTEHNSQIQTNINIQNEFQVVRNRRTNYKLELSSIHLFSQFQSCLGHIIHLNALLRNPIEQTKVAEIHNSTFLCELYNEFQSKPDIEVYMNNKFKNSVDLLQLFNSLLNLIKTPLAEVFNNEVNSDQESNIRNNNENRNLKKNPLSNNKFSALNKLSE